MAQSGIRNIANEYPSHFEDSFPFILRPDGTASRIVHRRQHLCHAAEVTTNGADVYLAKSERKPRGLTYLAFTLKNR